MKPIEVLLFDLGGVLVEFTGIEALQQMIRRSVDVAEIHSRLVESSVLRDFETGRLAPEVFAARFISEWDIPLAQWEFLAAFRAWSRGLYPGARELLADLNGAYRLAALSNSNATHWERNIDDLGIEALFELAMSSHQLGLHKPDPEIYREAARRLSVSPAQVVFFDDVAPNVVGARLAGMQAYHVQGIEALTACLRENGFMPRARL